MEFENVFEVPLPPEVSWRRLLDVASIVPAVPGAELVAIVDDKTYKGKVSVRLGPVALAFTGIAKFEEIDTDKLRARVSARGSDTKGRGGADAKIEFQLEPVDGGSRVQVRTVLNLTGSVAQYGRASGVIREVAAQITGEFAENLRKQIRQEVGAAPDPAAPTSSPGPTAPSARAAPAAPPVPAVKPISGGRLLWSVFKAWLRRLFTRRPATAPPASIRTEK